MPDVQFDCPKCGQNLNIDEGGAGMALQCPGCSKDIIVCLFIEGI